MRSSKQREVEERWGMPFWDLVRDFAGQGLSIAATARAIGYRADYFGKLLQSSGYRSLWERTPTLPVQYVADTGESFRAACERLAATTHLREAARQLGFASVNNLRQAMRQRGIDVEFQPYQRPPAKKREPSWTRIAAGEVDEYIRRRRDGQTSSQAADALGRQSRALWRAVKRFRPAEVPALMEIGAANKAKARRLLMH